MQSSHVKRLRDGQFCGAVGSKRSKLEAVGGGVYLVESDGR